MGITQAALTLLLQTGSKSSFHGKCILQLGRQHTFLTHAMVVNAAKKADYPLSPTGISKSHFIDDKALFTMLGFTTIHSLDVSDYEHATHIHDLNTPIPQYMHTKYDVVFNGGTLEHVFHVPQVLENIDNLLKIGGIVVHSTPSSNHVDHGFYMFSPTIFSDYYAENKYKAILSYIFEYNFEYASKWKVYQYIPGILDPLSFGGFGKDMVGIWFVAEKTPESTAGMIPQQGAYRKTWDQQSIPEKRECSKLRHFLKQIRSLRAIVLRVRKRISQFMIKHYHLKRIRF